MNNNPNNMNEQNNVQGTVPNQQVPVSSVSTPISTPANQGVNPSMNSQSTTAASSVEVLTEETSNTVPPVDPVSNYKPPSKFKYTMLILFFFGLLIMIFFLPQITEFMESLKTKQQPTEEKITTGTLKCERTTESEDYDITYSEDYDFTDNKLKRLTYTKETKGDAVLDQENLESLNEKCKVLSSIAQDLEGISVSCNLSSGLMSERQIIDFYNIDLNEVTAAYSEAGGVYPYDDEKGRDMDEVEKEMNSMGYTCQRVK